LTLIKHLPRSAFRLPRLAAMAYTGPVHATSTTAELLEVLLLDSAHFAASAIRCARSSAGAASTGLGAATHTP